MKVGISGKRHPPVGIIFDELVGAGSQGIPIRRDVEGLEPGLREKGVGLPGAWGKKGHGEPELELGIFSVNMDPQRGGIDDLKPLHRIAAEVEPLGAIRALIPFFLEPRPKVLETHDLFPHQFGNGGVDFRVHQPLDLIGQIFGGDLPRSHLLKIGKRMDLREGPRRECVIAKGPGRLPCKGGVRCITKIRAQPDFINALEDFCIRYAFWQAFAVGAEIEDLWIFGSRQWLQGIGPFQIGVLKGRLDHLGNHLVLVGTVGPRRIQVLGALFKGGIEGLGVTVGLGVGIVRGVTAAFKASQKGRHGKATPECVLMHFPLALHCWLPLHPRILLDKYYRHRIQKPREASGLV